MWSRSLHLVLWFEDEQIPARQGQWPGKVCFLFTDTVLVPINALLFRRSGRITLFAAALEAASNGEEQTQTSPEDGP